MNKLCLGLVLVVLAMGCKGGVAEDALVGKWKGEVKMPESSKDDPMAKMGEAMMSMMAMDLELKADKKFTLMVFIIPISGDWSLSGNVVTLQPTTVMGLTPEEFAKQQAKEGEKPTGDPNDVKKPMRLEVQPDGKSMKALDDIGGQKSQGDFIFVKK
jgi:hypothetical protein